MKRQLEEEISVVTSRLSSCRKLVVLTGAGVSRESGIPTFREAQTGLWANCDPERLATPQGFLADPALVWQWYDSRRKMLSTVKPNPGHYALVELEKLVGSFVIVTQNVDGLHALAGSSDVIELHGSMKRFRCFDANHPVDDVPVGLLEPPKCQCGSMLRPDVIWFGEALPEHALKRATEEFQGADIAFVVGTSGLVQPAASLPHLAKHNGAFVVEINPETTPITDIADVFLGGPAGTILHQVAGSFLKAQTKV